MATPKKGNVLSLVVYLLVFLFVVALIVGVIYYTNGLTTDFTAFYVQVDGKDVLKNAGGYVISPAQSMRIDVKYTWAFASQDLGGYSYEITANPNVDLDFDFTVDGETMSFQGELDWTKCFLIEEDDDGFSIRAKSGWVQGMLPYAFPDKTVTVDKDADYYVDDMFLLTVYSYDKDASITIKFTVVPVATVVNVDNEEIVF